MQLGVCIANWAEPDTAAKEKTRQSLIDGRVIKWRGQDPNWAGIPRGKRKYCNLQGIHAG
jgi:hypothetical protein